MTDTTNHWHVAAGLSGYGPDAGNTDYGTGTTIQETANLIKDELSESAESQYQTADSIAGDDANADDRDYKDAWWTMKRGEGLGTFAMNFDVDRLKAAPFYQEDPDKLDERLSRMIREEFPHQISDHWKLYVWECSEQDCEHLEEYESN